jgi:hypothetical protein
LVQGRKEVDPLLTTDYLLLTTYYLLPTT